MKIGLLDVQGCVDLHIDHFQALGVKIQRVKQVKDLLECKGLVLPGGESTAMIKLIKEGGLWDPLKNYVNEKPVWGICAGCLLLAKKIQAGDQDSLGVLDVEMTKNGTGRQVKSIAGEISDYPVFYIRAPIITKVSKVAKIYAQKDKNPVWIVDKNIMVTTFHPELGHPRPSPIHHFFLNFLAGPL